MSPGGSLAGPEPRHLRTHLLCMPISHASWPTLSLAATVLILGGCSNPFAPKPALPPDEPGAPTVAATTAAVVMMNLQRAFNEGDGNEVLYESIIDGDFWFTETDCQGDLILANGKEDPAARSRR